METLAPEELKKIPLFQNLDSNEVAEVLKLSERQDYAKDDFVFQQEDEAKRLFIVEKGLVAMVIQLKPGTVRVIATESRGGAFGWAALLPSQRHTTSAKCQEPSRLLVLDGTKVRELCYENPRLGVKVMEGLAQFIANRIYSTNLRMLDAMWI
ncbi:MAG: cyclic nucleotide-binding domain-containing protein [Dehalococcoidia bacterium]|nr:MAG: cyclic nucleotide-binding domain-containing protein [Dehalococcoidia bacterium]